MWKISPFEFFSWFFPFGSSFFALSAVRFEKFPPSLFFCFFPFSFCPLCPLSPLSQKIDFSCLLCRQLRRLFVKTNRRLRWLYWIEITCLV